MIVEEGQNSPFFIFISMGLDKDRFIEVIEKQLTDSLLFLVDIEVSAKGVVNVFIDGDEGVNLKDCIVLTKHIESEIDRDIEDYELTVSSAGLNNPLKLPRQYKKNVGRKLSIITTEDEQIEAELKNADEEGIEVYYKTREKINNKKKVVEHNISYKYNQIKEAKIVISFK